MKSATAINGRIGAPRAPGIQNRRCPSSISANSICVVSELGIRAVEEEPRRMLPSSMNPR